MVVVKDHLILKGRLGLSATYYTARIADEMPIVQLIEYWSDYLDWTKQILLNYHRCYASHARALQTMVEPIPIFLLLRAD